MEIINNLPAVSYNICKKRYRYGYHLQTAGRIFLHNDDNRRDRSFPVGFHCSRDRSFCPVFGNTVHFRNSTQERAGSTLPDARLFSAGRCRVHGCGSQADQQLCGLRRRTCRRARDCHIGTRGKRAESVMHRPDSGCKKGRRERFYRYERQGHAEHPFQRQWYHVRLRQHDHFRRQADDTGRGKESGRLRP